MSFRDRLNKYRTATAVVVTLLVAVALWVAFAQVSSAGGVKKAFYTNDDGKTFFEDSVDRVPGFDKDGKPAYGASVLDCKGQRQVFCMMRFAEKSRLAIEKARDAGELAKFDRSKLVREYKRPGDTAWVAGDSPAGFGQVAAMQSFKCPDGSTGEVVLP